MAEDDGLKHEIDLLREEGDSAYETGDWDVALLKYKAMTALGLSLNIKEALAEGYRKSGHVERLRGNQRKAKKLYDKALDISRAIGDGPGVADLYRGLSYLSFRRAEFGQALSFGEQALDQVRSLGDAELTGKVLIDLGNVHCAVGRYDEALGCYNEALKVLPKGGFFQRGRALNNIGETLKRKGLYDEALKNFERIIVEGVETGDSNNRAWALFGAAECHARGGNLSRAEEYIQMSDQLLRRSSDEVGLQELMKVWGIVLKLKGDIERARGSFEESIMMGKRLDLPPETASSYLELGRFLEEQGDMKGARNCYLQACALFDASGMGRELEEAKGLLEGLKE